MAPLGDLPQAECAAPYCQRHPVGLMIAAGPWHESQVLPVGAAFERATEWHNMKPPIAP